METYFWNSLDQARDDTRARLSACIQFIDSLRWANLFSLFSSDSKMNPLEISLQNNVCDRDSFQQFLKSSLSGRQQRKTKIEGLARRWGKLLLGGGKNCQDRCDKDKTKKGKRNTDF